MELTREALIAMIDHTQVRAYATHLDIAELCDEAAEYSFAAVTVNPTWIAFCARRLAGTGVEINATIGFPLGASSILVKVEEAKEAIRNGATELDMVINIGALKSCDTGYVGKEIAAVVNAAYGQPVKVILETCYLSTEEKRLACELCIDAGAAFVKTSTGFGTIGATTEDVRLLRETVGDKIGVKAAGGIRHFLDVKAMIDAGATRIGTSSSVSILDEMAAHDEAADPAETA